MSEFKVNTASLRSYSNQLETVQSQLNWVATKLTGMQLGSILQIKGSTALIGKITDCKWAAVNQAQNLGKLANGLDSIAGIYDKYEKDLKDPKKAPQTSAQQQGGGIINFDDIGSNVLDIGGQLLDKFGNISVPFSIAALINNCAKGGADGVVSGLKNINDIIGNGTEAIFDLTTGGVRADWVKGLLGFDLKNETFGEAMESYIDSFKFGKNTAKNVKAATQWAGVALDVAESAVGNWDEFDGDLSNARFWGETVIEAGVDIAIGAGATALASAALGAAATAIGVAGAPAILVGAAAAGVVWAANGICEYITGGRDIAEVVADAACDFTEAAIDVGKKVVEEAKEVGKKVAEGAKEVGKALEKGAKAVCKFFGF